MTSHCDTVKRESIWNGISFNSYRLVHTLFAFCSLDFSYFHIFSYNEFKNSHMSVIARETLEEVPDQVTGFMSMHGIKPNPPKNARSNTMDNLYGEVKGNHDPNFNPNDPYGNQ